MHFKMEQREVRFYRSGMNNFEIAYILLVVLPDLPERMFSVKQKPFLLIAFAILALLLAACGSFQDNPHGPAYIYTLTPTASGPVVPPGKGKLLPHFSSAGFGASLQSLRDQYGDPTGLSRPPIYAFGDGVSNKAQLAQLLVTMKDGQAIEFSYVPQHPMTYQEGEDFATKLLPDDLIGPTVVQKEDSSNGTCLAQTFKSTVLANLFPKSAFLSPDGKDDTPGSVTVNFYPNFYRDTDQTINTSNPGPIDSVSVSSVLVNLGTRPSC